MAEFKKRITELIGNTPLLELANYNNNHQLDAKIVAKLEYFNPGGSVKDRIAKKMIEEALKSGEINQDTVIIEPTSGNTGIGLASVCASYGLKLIIAMPETMSVERRNLMKAYGAELVLTEGSKGMKGAVDKSLEIKNEIPNSFIPSQFENPNNPKVHEETTGVEIWDETEGQVDIFVAGVGTGGTVSGVGAYLKSKNPNIQIIAVEPADSPLLTEGHSGAHKIQGLGPNFVPNTLNRNIYNEIITVTNENAFETGREIAKKEGVLVGISSGAALWAATKVAKRPENAGKLIVVLLPDTGERYLSTPMFS
ncbi:MAG: cysteine synthase A [Herbinix sp.]|nr:cysteine synthase A [Herbinix sp.]